MEVFLTAIIIGLIPAFIAKAKGHSFLAWWLFGALLWIVALPWAIFLKPEHAALGERKCPACAEWIKVEAKVCKYCGTQSGPMTSGFRQCGHCAEPMPADARFCKICGAPLEIPSTSVPSA
jgi:RNA polymerase subunit RPABC4/transcription elongation factor Spt4